MHDDMFNFMPLLNSARTRMSVTELIELEQVLCDIVRTGTIKRGMHGHPGCDEKNLSVIFSRIGAVGRFGAFTLVFTRYRAEDFTVGIGTPVTYDTDALARGELRLAVMEPESISPPAVFA